MPSCANPRRPSQRRDPQRRIIDENQQPPIYIICTSVYFIRSHESRHVELYMFMIPNFLHIGAPLIRSWVEAILHARHNKDLLEMSSEERVSDEPNGASATCRVIFR